MFIFSEDMVNLDDMQAKKLIHTYSSKEDSFQKKSYQERKTKEKSIRKLANKIVKIEKEITEMEVVQKELDLKLSDPKQFQEISKKKDFFKDYEVYKNKIVKKEQEWDKLVEELDKLKKK